MSAEVDRAVAVLPQLTKNVAVSESDWDDGFWSYFSPLALSSDPVGSVDRDMTRALINEFDPSRHRGSKGRWPVLRFRFGLLLRRVTDKASQRASLPRGPDSPPLRGLGLGPVLRAVAEGYALAVKQTTGIEPMSGLGQDLDVGELIVAGANLLGNLGLQAWEGREMRQLQEQRLELEEARLAQAQAAEARRRQEEAARRQARAAAIAAGVAPAPGEAPSWWMYALIAAGVVAGGFVLSKVV